MLPESAARHLEQQAWALVPGLMQELIGAERPVLMEVACSGNSILTRTVQQQTGKECAALQCAEWNHCDLGTPQGITLVLEQIEQLRPQHVWIAPTGSAFSPMQNLNQKTPKQQAEPQEKRQAAMKLYKGCVKVMFFCAQSGIHATWEWPERCQAWRLPIIQSMLRDLGLHVATTQGCRVNLRESEQGSFLQKGWKLATTHQRLAEVMHMPCHCPCNYQHARSESRLLQQSGSYTPEYAKRVVSVLLQELNHQGVVQECKGQSSLLEGFGEGPRCTCGSEKRTQQESQCAWCLLQEGNVTLRPLNPDNLKLQEPWTTGGDMADQGQGFFGDSEGDQGEVEVQELCESCEGLQECELLARKLYEQNNFSHDMCEQLLQAIPRGQLKTKRNLAKQPCAIYITFGLYAHGAMYGVTRNTEQFPNVVRYLNSYLKKHCGGEAKWTSVVINFGSRLPLHRDLHNSGEHPNHMIGLGPYTGGELWVGEHRPGNERQKTTTKVLPDGSSLSGSQHPTRHRVVQFYPKQWHQTQAWVGDRITVTGFVSRGYNRVSSGVRRSLWRKGFEVPAVRARVSDTCQSANVADTSNSNSGVAPLSQKEEERIKHSLYKLHAATGHGSTRHLVTALRRRGASESVLRLAQDFSCPICAEKRHVTPRHVASLEPLPPRWSTLAGDVGDWRHPTTGEHVQFLLLIDENSRYRVARILTRGVKQTPSAAACLHYIREGWIQYFGEPQTIRLDPAGAFRSKALEEFADRHHIYLDIIPGEAHWQMSACEGAIKGVKEVMNKLADEDDQITPEAALATAILTFNQRDVIRGFSPMQLAFGCGRDAMGRMTQEVQQLPEELQAANASGEFQDLLKRQAIAEKAMVDWRTKERLDRAQHSRPQPTRHYAPGDLVFYWRTQESGQSKKKPGSKQGRFLGPARILATETKRDAQGALRPGSAVWCVRGRTLIKCAPEQLRPASQRELLVESLVEADGVPWTFTRVSQSIGGNQYEDVSAEVPSLEEWQRAQDIQQEAPSRISRRISMKRPGPSSRTTDNQQDDEMEVDVSPEGSEPQRPRLSAAPTMGESASSHWTTQVEEHAFLAQESSYWSERNAAVAVEVDVPTSKRGLQAMSRDLTHFFVGAFKRRAVEVNERKLNAQDLEKFREAKAVEVKNFLAARAFEAVPEHMRPSKEQAVGMRWILTWKLREDGSYKAKARAVLLGYQDPAYEHRDTTAPVMTRQTRQMMLQVASMKGWRLRKGDVSGAFLQGREYPDLLHCVPCDEICVAMGLEKGSVTRLRKACYGLVDAPLEWYRTVASFLEQLGLQRLWSDACAWVWRPQGQLRGMISGHVDDFLFGGSDKDKDWQDILDQIKAKFKWGDWEEESFVQCGVLIRQTEAGFELSQEQYIDSISEIPVGAVRRKERDAETTEREKGQLRALLGS